MGPGEGAFFDGAGFRPARLAHVVVVDDGGGLAGAEVEDEEEAEEVEVEEREEALDAIFEVLLREISTKEAGCKMPCGKGRAEAQARG